MNITASFRPDNCKVYTNGAQMRIGSVHINTKATTCANTLT